MSPASSALLGAGLLTALAIPHSVTAHEQEHAGRQVAVTFRLNVRGPIPRGMTFWIAYGPLADRFGIVRLVHIGPHRYAVRTTLLADARSVFSYVAGFGTTRTREGQVPCPPITTIQTVGPTTPVKAARVAVRWEAPVG